MEIEFSWKKWEKYKLFWLCQCHSYVTLLLQTLGRDCQ